MKKILAYYVCFICLVSTLPVLAAIQSLIKEYTYQASELDSKTSSRAIAVEQVKRELLEELGTYVESSTVVSDYQIQKDEIRTLTAGVVQTKILDEKWDGKTYWLKAEVSADPDEVAASIEKLKTDQKLTEELAEAEKEKDDALKEVERLKQELSGAAADKEKIDEYQTAVNQLQAADVFEEGTAFSAAGDYAGAAKAYNRAIELNPVSAKAYFNRSIVYIYLGDYESATRDLDRAMILKPARTSEYYQRAAAYKDLREKRALTQTQRTGRFPNRQTRLKDDPLQRYLDKKQAQYHLVRGNPLRKSAPIHKPVRPVLEKPALRQPTFNSKRPSVSPPASRNSKTVVSPRLHGRSLPTRPDPVREPSRPGVRKPSGITPKTGERRKAATRPQADPP